jgi:predicted nucleotidyltransferase
MNASVKKIMAELRPALEKIYGERLVKVVLFGSHARGDAVTGSDIDVLVVLKGPVQPGTEIARIGAATAALSLERDVVISCVFVSELRYKSEQSPLLINVRKEGIPA